MVPTWCCASFTPDLEAEAAHFGTPEAIAIRPKLQWARVALVLFDLLNTLCQHNVNAMVHDLLCFYAVHDREVDTDMVTQGAALSVHMLGFAWRKP